VTTDVRSLVMGFRSTQLVGVAAELGIADELVDGPRRVEDLAEAVGADAGALARLLRGLRAVGVFTETADGRIAIDEAGQQLRSDAPGSLRAVARLYASPWLWDVYGRTARSVRTGRPAFPYVHGRPLYEHLDVDAEAQAAFDAAMAGFSGVEHAAVLDAYDLGWARSVVDVGGGNGALLAAILAAHPGATGVLFDRPAVVAAAPDPIGPGLDGRVSVVGGDFFDAVPAGNDAYVLKSVLHNWPDAAAVTILRACRRALGPDGRVLVVERVLDRGPRSAEAALFDVNMLVVTGGRERSESGYRQLADAAGLRVSDVVPTATALQVVELVPA
jgi:SAM-dependent methyltransferase